MVSNRFIIRYTLPLMAVERYSGHSGWVLIVSTGSICHCTPTAVSQYALFVAEMPQKGARLDSFPLSAPVSFRSVFVRFLFLSYSGDHTFKTM